MQLEETVKKETIRENVVGEGKRLYSIFAEQFLEKPAYGGEDKMAYTTPTVCTWRGVPTIDDW